eukprot:IDg5394t1
MTHLQSLPLLEALCQRYYQVIELGRDLYFDEIVAGVHHQFYPHLMFRKLHKPTEVEPKASALCTTDRNVFDYEPAVIGHSKLAPQAAILRLCKSLERKNY